MYKFRIDISGDYKLDIKGEYVFGLYDEWADNSHYRVQLYNSMGQQALHGFHDDSGLLLQVSTTSINQNALGTVKNMHISFTHRRNCCQEGELSSFILSRWRILIVWICCLSR